jgi:hypothetical protein
MKTERATQRCRCGTRLARDNAGRLCTICQRQNRVIRQRPPRVPASFWQHPAIGDALETWHIGRVIAAYRLHPWHGQAIPQEVVAGWLGVSQARLSRIETGPPVQDLPRLTELATLLAIPAELLWFKVPGTQTTFAPTSEPQAPNVLQGLVGTAAEESLHFASVAAELPMHVDLLDHLRWEVGRIAVDYVHAPLHTIVQDLVTARDSIFDLLRQQQRPRAACDLHFLGGTVCLLLAHASQNVGNQRAALAQLRTAWTLADVADHDALRAWARGTAALIHEWSQHQHRATELAHQGIQFQASPQSKIRLAAIEARAAARQGDQAGALDALTRVEAAQQADDTVDGVTTFGGVLSFPPAKQQYYLGSTYGLLGKHELAERYATAAISVYESGPLDERSYGDEALARLDVTNARLAVGDLNGAHEAITPVLTLPAECHIRQLDTAIGRTRSLLNQPGTVHNRATPELRDRLTDYLIAAGQGHRALASTE